MPWSSSCLNQRLQRRQSLRIGLADDHRGVAGGECGCRLLLEFDRAGAVDEGEPVAEKLDVGDIGLDAHAVLARLRARVSDARLLRYRALALDRAGASQNGFEQRCLAGEVGSDQCNAPGGADMAVAACGRPHGSSLNQAQCSVPRHPRLWQWRGAIMFAPPLVKRKACSCRMAGEGTPVRTTGKAVPRLSFCPWRSSSRRAEPRPTAGASRSRCACRAAARCGHRASRP